MEQNFLKNRPDFYIFDTLSLFLSNQENKNVFIEIILRIVEKYFSFLCEFDVFVFTFLIQASIYSKTAMANFTINTG